MRHASGAQAVFERAAHLGRRQLEREDRVLEGHDLVDGTLRDHALRQIGAQAPAVLEHDVDARCLAHRVADEVADRRLGTAAPEQPGVAADRQGGERRDVRVPARDACRHRGIRLDLVRVRCHEARAALDHAVCDRVHHQVAHSHDLPVRARNHHRHAADRIEHPVVAVASEPGVNSRDGAREPQQVPAVRAPRGVGLGRDVADDQDDVG